MSHRSYILTLKPCAAQRDKFLQHSGARRFAFNHCRQRQTEAFEAYKKDPTVKVPWSAFDFINDFNQFKVSAAAGMDDAGQPGLPWRHQLLQQVFEEGCRDFADGVRLWHQSRKRGRKKGGGKSSKSFKGKKATKSGQSGPRVGYPRFCSRKRDKPTFRLRNTSKHTRFTIHPDAIALPSLGRIPVRRSTGTSLRQLLRKRDHEDQPIATIRFVTFSFVEGHWRASVNVEVKAAVDRRGEPVALPPEGPALGCDAGLHTLVMVAREDGSARQPHLTPKEVAAGEPALRRLQRALGLKRHASRQRQQAAKAEHRQVGRSELRARRRLAHRHARIRHIRNHAMHVLTTKLAKSHRLLGVEDLYIAGMMKNHCLAGPIGRQAWGEFKRQLSYKSAWLGGEVVVANRFFPSSKRCSRCAVVRESLSLAERIFACTACGHRIDRDVNAAANLAWYAQQSITRGPQEAGPVIKPELSRLGPAPSQLSRDRLPVGRSQPDRRRKGIGAATPKSRESKVMNGGVG